MQNDWAYNELADVPLWDRRCLQTLVAACETLADNPERSFSAALGSRRKAVSRILHHETTTQQDLLSAHIRATTQRIHKENLLLIASDTTFFNFSHHPATTGLGPICDKPKQQGFLVHSALALNAAGVPLGVLYQDSWARDLAQVGSAKQRRERAYADKESHKWLQALRAVEKHVAPTQKAVLIQDREADIFEFFSAKRQDQVDLLIRAAQPRRIVTEGEGGPSTLLAAIAQAQVVATKTLLVPPGPQRVERNACLTLRLASLTILPPRHSSDPKGAPLRLTVVRACEENPPEGVKDPLEWVLLTTLCVDTAEEALCVLDYYSLRWRIERFHFVLKSGCGFERLQLDRLDTLQKALSLFSIIAWRLLFVTYLARDAPQTPCETVLSGFEQEVLERYTKKRVATVQDVVFGVAELAGFARMPSAPHPGVKVLWQGLRRLQDMTQGYLLARQFPQ